MNRCFSPSAASAEAGLGVGDAGGVEMDSTSLLIHSDSANLNFSSGQDSDRGFTPQFSTGCQTDEGRGTQDDCTSALSHPGSESEEHNFLLAGGSALLCIADESLVEQFLQYVRLGRCDG